MTDLETRVTIKKLEERITRLEAKLTEVRRDALTARDLQEACLSVRLKGYKAEVDGYFFLTKVEAAVSFDMGSRILTTKCST
jgi:hypothetical protein